MVNVPSIFHTASKAQNPKTRIRVYFIDDTVDCWDDDDVQTNGTLLKRNVSDTDSNGRISITSSPVTFTEYYMPNTDVEIGRCVSNTLSLTFLNDDGALNNFTFGRCKIYIDIYTSGLGGIVGVDRVGSLVVGDTSQNGWVSVPMGVYIIDIPVRRLVANISATAYDQMQLLDADASGWFSSLSWENGINSWGIFSSMCTHLGLHIASGTTSSVMCLPYTYSVEPFSAANMTYRDILSYLAQANGCVATFDRNGSMQLIPLFDDSTTSYGYSNADGYFEFDRAEYTSAAIDGCSVKSSKDDVGVETAGDNMYLISENAFLNALPTTQDAQDACDALAALFTSKSFSYTPASFRTIGDWSLCAGDCISISFKGWSGVIPIMQQTLRWQGSSVEVTVSCTGNATLPQVPNRVIRQQLQTAHSIHELRVTSEELLSRIIASDGNYSEIVQQFNSIVTIVSAVSDALNAAQSQITQLSNSVEIGFSETSDEFMDLYSFIRLIASGIVIGKSTSDIKLKLENDILYFFTGNEENVTTSNAIAYFSTNRLYVNNSTIQNLTLGTDTQALDVRILGSGDNVCAFFGGRLG